jgi:hypothetical protein
MLDRHEIDGGEFLEPHEALVAHHRGLPLVLVDAEAGFHVEVAVGVHVRLLQVGQPAEQLLPEGRSATLREI